MMIRWMMFATIACSWIALSSSGQRATAQSHTWNRASATTGNWNDVANWLNGSLPVEGGSPTASLTFTQPFPLGATGYQANNDLTGNYQLNELILNARFGSYVGSTLNGLTIAGNGLNFVSNGLINPQIRIQGAAISLAAPVTLSAATVVTGAGHGHFFWNGPISGSGGITINRSSPTGQTVLSGNNTFSGGVTLQNGMLAIQAPGGSNVNEPSFTSALGTGILTISGGQLRFDKFPASSAGVGVSNLVVLQADLVFTGNNSGWFTNVISGSGGVINRGLSGQQLRLTGANTYTGRTEATIGLTGTSNTIQILRDGSILNSNDLRVTGVSNFIVDNTGPDAGLNNTDRLSNSAIVRAARGTFQFRGNSAAASTEMLGGFQFSGMTNLVVTPGTGHGTTLTLDNSNPLDRKPGGMMFLRGIGLGQFAPGTAGAANILLTNHSPTTIGGAGDITNVTATNVRIVPYLVGNDLNPNTQPISFVGVDPTNGLRILANTQYATTITDGATTTNNIRLANSQPITQPTTVNALILASGGTVTGAGTLTVSSGAVLTTSALTIDANLQFPGEGFFTTGNGTSTFAAGRTITGTAAGLILSGNNTGLILNGTLNVPGPLSINSAVLNVDAVAARLGPITELRLQGGGGLAPTAATDSSTIPVRVGAAGGTFNVANT
ncbi:MAG: hypothetical protein ACRCZF_27935, partial [Gemmataceae bacterium]